MWFVLKDSIENCVFSKGAVLTYKDAKQITMKHNWVSFECFATIDGAMSYSCWLSA